MIHRIFRLVFWVDYPSAAIEARQFKPCATVMINNSEELFGDKYYVARFEYEVLVVGAGASLVHV